MEINRLPFCRRIIRKFVYLTASLWDDETYLKLYFWCNLGYRLNLKNPRTYNEKLQWLKLYHRKPEYTIMVDKFEAKKYVSSVIGDEYIIPTLGVYDSIDDIDFDKLPDKFVIKTTHDSGSVLICKNKTSFDMKSLNKIDKALRRNFVSITREYPYKDVKPRIIIEKFMVDESGTELKDYKFFCFNGKCEFLFIATDRSCDVRFDFYDTSFNHLPFKQGHPIATKEIKKPKGFEKMIKLAELLAKNINPHVRVDFYNINGKIYFGELTFYHFSGIVPFEPNIWDYKIGELLILPKDSNK